MTYVGNPIDTTNTFQSLVGKRFSGDGSTTAFTLDVAPSSTLDIEVFVGNVRQDPNSAYTVSGTTLSFTGAPPSGTNNIYVVHQAKSVGTITPGANSVGVTELNLSDGSNGQFISTNGSGTLSFASVTTPAVTALNNATANELVTVGSTTTELDAEANLTFDGTQLSVLDTNAGTDNLLVKTTGDNQISMALEKSDIKFDIGLDHNNDGSKNFYIRERSEDGSTTNAVRMEIDNNGVVKVNNRIIVDADVNSSSKINAEFGGNSENGQYFNDKDGASHARYIGFERGGTLIGQIKRDGTNDNISYVTSSDYRLKDGVVNKTDGIEKIKLLKPRKFYWKSNPDKTLVDGFLAHEVSDIVPEAISGTKDDVDENDKIIPQGIDQSKLVPLLTAALQEAITKIETLETEMTALKARVTTLEE